MKARTTCVAAIVFGAGAWALGLGAQNIPPPGPGPTLTNVRALADLQAARIAPVVKTMALGRAVSAGEFAEMLLRTIGAQSTNTFSLTTNALRTAAQSVQARHFADNTTSFRHPAQPITRGCGICSDYRRSGERLAPAGRHSRQVPAIRGRQRFSDVACPRAGARSRLRGTRANRA